MKSLAITVMALFLATPSWASHESGPQVFYKTESYVDSRISSIGAAMVMTGDHSDFGVALATSIGAADVTDKQGYQQEYLAWEGSVKIGYFSDVFFYVEAGLDLGELVFDDRDEEHDYWHSHDHEHDYFYDDYGHDNDIDAFAGIGAGIKLGNLNVEWFSRIRNIDGENWQAPQQTYSGLQFSISF